MVDECGNGRVVTRQALEVGHVVWIAQEANVEEQIKMGRQPELEAECNHGNAESAP